MAAETPARFARLSRIPVPPVVLWALVGAALASTGVGAALWPRGSPDLSTPAAAAERLVRVEARVDGLEETARETRADLREIKRDVADILRRLPR